MWSTWALIASLLLLLVLSYNLFPDYSGEPGMQQLAMAAAVPPAGPATRAAFNGSRMLRRGTLLQMLHLPPGMNATPCRPQVLGASLQLPGHDREGAVLLGGAGPQQRDSGCEWQVAAPVLPAGQPLLYGEPPPPRECAELGYAKLDWAVLG